MSTLLTGLAGPLLVVIVAVFFIILCVLWVILPFAVFGIKDRLNKLVTETNLQNQLLTEVRDILKRVG